MTSLDWIVFSIVGLSTFLGVLRGLMRETLSLLSWMLAFVGAKHFAPLLAPVMPGLDSPALRHAAALLVVFLLVLVLASLVSAIVGKLISMAGLGFYDRFLGAIFGVLRAIVALAGLTLIVGLTALPKTLAWQQAYTRQWLEDLVGKLNPWLPPELTALIRY